MKFNNVTIAALSLSFAAIVMTPTANASSATVAGTAKWNGNTGNLGSMCKFTKNVAGTMTFDEASNTWTTTSPAEFHVKTRGNNNINVIAYEKLLQGSSEIADVQVDYQYDTVITGPAGLTINLNDDDISVGMNGKRGKLEFELGGTAVVTNDDIVFGSNQSYSINHEVTCIQ